MPTCQPVVQPVKTAVMETLSCCVPGEIGTDFPAAAAALLMANWGTGWAGAWSVMLTTGPSGSPRAFADCVAFASAAGTAPAPAPARSELASVRVRGMPLTRVAVPPAGPAAARLAPAGA